MDRLGSHEVCYNCKRTLNRKAIDMTPTEIEKLQRFLRQTFGNHGISLARRPEAVDSAELQINGETFGAVYRDEDEGELSYNIQMTVLSEDLTWPLLFIKFEWLEDRQTLTSRMQLQNQSPAKHAGC